MKKEIASAWIALGLLTCISACDRTKLLTLSHDADSGSATSTLSPRADTSTAAVPPIADTGRLPEDPEAGMRSTLQWREHLDEEERERQMIFDGQRLKPHRSLIKLLVTARSRLEGARSAGAVTKERAGFLRLASEVQRRLASIDPWGNSSRLLPDYQALLTSLSTQYPDAKLAKLHGDPDSALESARADFDRRLSAMNAWLEVAREGENEGEHEGDHETEREREAERETKAL